MLDQQLAATLQAQIGDTVTLTPRPGARPRRFRVSGVALVTAPDVLFQPLNPLLGPAPAQPPANIAILPLGDVRRARSRRQLPSIAAGQRRRLRRARRPDRRRSGRCRRRSTRPRSAARPAHALHARRPDPQLASSASLPGQVQFVDNLSDSLNTAAGDALYAETLYIMLAVPGALVALGLAYLAALGTVDRDRRDLALLRARGATPPRPARARRARERVARRRRRAARDRPRARRRRAR